MRNPAGAEAVWTNKKDYNEKKNPDIAVGLQHSKSKIYHRARTDMETRASRPRTRMTKRQVDEGRERLWRRGHPARGH